MSNASRKREKAENRKQENKNKIYFVLV